MTNSPSQVGRLFFARRRSDRDGDQRLEMEVRYEGSKGQRRVAVLGLTAAVLTGIGLIIWGYFYRPFIGPILGVVLIVAAMFTAMWRSSRRVGRRVIGDAEEIRVHDTTSRGEEIRERVPTASVSRVGIGELGGFRTVWVETPDQDRVLLLERLRDDEAEASAERLRMLVAD